MKKILDLSSIKNETVKLLMKLLKGGKIGFDVEDIMVYEREVSRSGVMFKEKRRDLKRKRKKAKKDVLFDNEKRRAEEEELDFKSNEQKMLEEASSILEQVRVTELNIAQNEPTGGAFGPAKLR